MKCSLIHPKMEKMTPQEKETVKPIRMRSQNLLDVLGKREAICRRAFTPPEWTDEQILERHYSDQQIFKKVGIKCQNI